MTKKTKVKSGNITVHVNISPELAFWCALTLASTREEVTTKSLLSHPIGPVPTALFHDDGTMRKCTHADLSLRLETLGSKFLEIPDHDQSQTVYI